MDVFAGFRVSAFVTPGQQVSFYVERPQEMLSSSVRNYLTRLTSDPRTLQQDIEFGVLQIVDIALKAISPAVNDSEQRHQLRRPTEQDTDSFRFP